MQHPGFVQMSVKWSACSSCWCWFWQPVHWELQPPGDWRPAWQSVNLTPVPCSARWRPQQRYEARLSKTPMPRCRKWQPPRPTRSPTKASMCTMTTAERVRDLTRHWWWGVYRRHRGRRWPWQCNQAAAMQREVRDRVFVKLFTCFLFYILWHLVFNMWWMISKWWLINDGLNLYGLNLSYYIVQLNLLFRSFVLVCVLQKDSIT